MSSILITTVLKTAQSSLNDDERVQISDYGYEIVACFETKTSESVFM